MSKRTKNDEKVFCFSKIETRISDLKRRDCICNQIQYKQCYNFSAKREADRPAAPLVLKQEKEESYHDGGKEKPHRAVH